MALVALRFLAILFTALALAPGVDHLAAWPNNYDLPREAYFAAQGLYRGWELFGIALVGALILNGALAWTHRHWRPSFALASFATLAMAASLAAFFIWTFPANRATTNWTAMPENWEALRRNWEMGHAIGAVCTLVALVSVTLAALRAPQTTPTAG